MIFTLLPVILLASAQLLVALLLLAPMTIASPALRLCKLSQTPVGQTCLATMSVVLVVSLISPVSSLSRCAFNACWVLRGGSCESAAGLGFARSEGPKECQILAEFAK